MPVEMLTDERVAPHQVPPEPHSAEEGGAEEAGDAELRKFAKRHLENVRKFKVYVAVYLLSLLVLTPVWVVTQYETAEGWPEHLSSRSRYPGDWDPWIIWVALIGGVLVAIAGLRAYWFDRRPTTESDIDREVERLKSR